MGYRFRRSIKIGGLKFNLYRSGISLSTGIRGANITIGQRGIFGNVGIPGSGISYRSKIAGYSQPKIQRMEPEELGQPIQRVPVKFVIDDETGESSWKDENMNPLSENIIQVAKKQNRETIYKLLQETSDKINDKIVSLLNIHLKTPPPDTIISYTSLVYQGDKPISPNIAQYKLNKPDKPILKEKNLLSKKVSFLGKQLEKSNQKIMDEYDQKKIEWQRNQSEMDKKLEKANKEYEDNLAKFEKEKSDFDNKQIQIKQLIEVDRLNNTEAMNFYLEEYLDALEWKLDTNVSFEINDRGKQILIDLDLPEIEMMPNKNSKVNHNKLNLTITVISKRQQQINYLTHIHAIGFRVVGETFIALPSIEEVVLSGYSQRPNKKTGHIENEYLYSVRVKRSDWEKINFLGLESVNIIECFELFDLRRIINKSGIIEPIEPFSNEMTTK